MGRKWGFAGGTVAKAKVVATALPTWLTALAVIITAVAPQIAALVPGHAEDITRWAVTVAGWLGAAVVIIRNVTPTDAKGVLPK